MSFEIYHNPRCSKSRQAPQRPIALHKQRVVLARPPAAIETLLVASS